jgi:hypothetical protein
LDLTAANGNPAHSQTFSDDAAGSIASRRTGTGPTIAYAYPAAASPRPHAPERVGDRETLFHGAIKQPNSLGTLVLGGGHQYQM